MKRLVPSLLFFLLVTAGTARAAETVVAQPAPALPFQLSLDAETVWHLDRGYRVFSSDRSDAGGGYSAALDVARVARGTLAVGAGLQGGGAEQGLYQGQLRAKLDLLTPAIFATLRWPVHRWFQPHLRVAADGTWAKLSLTPADGQTLSGRDFSPGASAGLGFSLRTSALRTAIRNGTVGLAAALIFEGGFHVGAPLGFEVTRNRPTDDKLANDRLPAGSTAVGDLGRSQPYLRISFALLI
jgi:hypothetical protein